jgi:signal transduction histidine kinase
VNVFVRSLRPAHLVAVDVLAALVLSGAVAVAALDEDTPGAAHEPVWVSWLTAVVVGLPMAARRRWPVPVLGVVLVAVLAALLSGVVPLVAIGPTAVAVAFALYAVGRLEPRVPSVRALVVALGAVLAAIVVSRATASSFLPWSETFVAIALCWFCLGAVWAFGVFAQERQRYAERAAAQATKQAVADERLRIARELHDIVAHSMSLIAVKAGIGNHVAAERPDEAREALRVIEATSRGSLTEMRHLLGVLRSEVDSPKETSTLAPSPGVANIPDLAERAAAAGVTVDTDLSGTESLPDGVSLSVYRIVQEAVTNVVRHAAPAHCVVRVAAAGERVHVEITDDGRTPATEGSGHGLIGMRERVMMYGGEFSAGRRDDGEGFRVTATFPYERTAE